MAHSSFMVDARTHSISGGAALDTGIALSPGQLLLVNVDPAQTWSAGVADRTSNANGLGNPLGGDYGLHSRGAQSFLFGALVGSLDGGSTFFGVGTHLSMTILTEGTLSFYYWDSNHEDNSGHIRVVVQVYDGPRV
ncbi:hypothetical protein [Nannocystis punicea]|uniref:Inclusion body protein n=1 Tax=Nannocystis punicea TaxID=2995304 RepID=A0ABY7GZK5_9BACT|nr:hypothetical protein [Nannocystis poenicansa]WAS92441.1 hypothetical protein O0S08_40195 [Nannocystis poenicansa]